MVLGDDVVVGGVSTCNWTGKVGDGVTGTGGGIGGELLRSGAVGGGPEEPGVNVAVFRGARPMLIIYPVAKPIPRPGARRAVIAGDVADTGTAHAKTGGSKKSDLIPVVGVGNDC